MINIFLCSHINSYELESVSLESGTTIAQFLQNKLKLDIETKVGVYGKIKDKSYVLRDNDRLEIYEMIVADPKINRSKRANNESQ